MNIVLAYITAHPEIVPLIAWPLGTALLSFVHDAIERRSPGLASLLRKSGLNLAGILRALGAPKAKP